LKVTLSRAVVLQARSPVLNRARFAHGLPIAINARVLYSHFTALSVSVPTSGVDLNP
jgi:hypothetical protein